MKNRNFIAGVAVFASLLAGPAGVFAADRCTGQVISCSQGDASSCSMKLACCSLRSSLDEPAVVYEGLDAGTGAHVDVASARIPAEAALFLSSSMGTASPHRQGPPLFLKVRALLI
jgi:hypothetical protein